MRFAPGGFILLSGGIKGAEKIIILINITGVAAGGDLKMLFVAQR